MDPKTDTPLAWLIGRSRLIVVVAVLAVLLAAFSLFLLGAWLAHERFSASELAAMGVILLGVVAITLAKASKAKPAVVVAEEGAA